MNQKNKNIILFILTLITASALTLSYFLFLKGNTFWHKEKTISVNRGETFNDVVEKFHNAGIIKSKKLFKWAGVIIGYDRKIQIGKYKISSGSSNLSILNTVTDPAKAIRLNVILWEGLSAKHYVSILKNEVGIDSVVFMNELKKISYLKFKDNSVKNIEGFLIPDTYEFYWQQDETEIIKKIVLEFNNLFVDSLQRRMKQMNLTLNELMTMASIVEGETRHHFEKPIIAGVYYNRLKKRMRLEADPTIQYIIDDGPRRLLYEDLKINSPYNTYLNFGLPPGPVNSPSRESILSALYPAKHNYLFFVSNGIKGHTFANTFEEHKKNIRIYRKILAQKKK